MLSSTPVTVTVCGVFQLLGVKVRLDVDNFPSVLAIPSILMVTGFLGWALSTTVKSLVPPGSVVVPMVGVTVIPASLMSVTLRVKSVVTGVAPNTLSCTWTVTL